MSKYAVKCEQTVTFYIDVEADNEWQAQHKAEYIQREDKRLGYYKQESSIRSVNAVEREE